MWTLIDARDVMLSHSLRHGGSHSWPFKKWIDRPSTIGKWDHIPDISPPLVAEMGIQEGIKRGDAFVSYVMLMKQVGRRSRH